jgi:hypothetical protein
MLFAVRSWGLAALQAEVDANGEVDWDLHFVNSTIVRAHQLRQGRATRSIRTGQ